LGKKTLLGEKEYISEFFYETLELSTTIRLRTLDLLHLVIANKYSLDAFLTLDKEIIKRADTIEKILDIEVIYLET